MSVGNTATDLCRQFPISKSLQSASLRVHLRILRVISEYLYWCSFFILCSQHPIHEVHLDVPFTRSSAIAWHCAWDVYCCWYQFNPLKIQASFETMFLWCKIVDLLHHFTFTYCGICLSMVHLLNHTTSGEGREVFESYSSLYSSVDITLTCIPHSNLNLTCKFLPINVNCSIGNSHDFNVSLIISGVFLKALTTGVKWKRKSLLSFKKS